MKSTQLFLQSHPNSKEALKISEGDFARHEQLYEIPLYAIEAWLSQ